MMGLLFVIATCAMLRAACAESAEFSTSITLDHAAFLSTQTATATLKIFNASANTIYYNWYRIRFLVHTASGWSIPPDRVMGGSFDVAIKPHTLYTRSIDLPSCTVTWRPCFEQVILQYHAGNPQGLETRRSQLLEYEFIPDPQATYHLAGVGENRPVFIVYGTARDRIYPDTLVLEFTPTPSESTRADFSPWAFQQSLLASFKGEGLDAGPGRWGWDDEHAVADIGIDHFAEQRTLIESKVSKVRNEVSRRAMLKSQFLTVSLFGSGTAGERAFADAGRQAAALAQIVDAGTSTYASTYAAVPAHVLFGDDQYPVYPLTSPEWPSVTVLDPLKLPLANASPTPILLSQEAAFVGSRAISTPPQSVTDILARPAFRFGHIGVAAIEPIAEMSSDRPELYVVGEAADEPALHAALAPEFAAIADARVETGVLASLLRVHVERPTLFTAYPSLPRADARAIGVASTFYGFNIRMLHELRAQA
ncbi:MAG TPA: hypothetical protein VKT72_01530, partial [Candidatus Baltobacteraceae bacterium]|nr:hypothetical protein [Candidatus Baltobacteraceae bacterium]